MNVNAKRDNSRIKEIEIMDCTLRDGEQTKWCQFPSSREVDDSKNAVARHQCRSH